MRFSCVLFSIALVAQAPLVDQGRALVDKNENKAAVDVLTKAVAAAPNSAEAHYQLGRAYAQMAQHASFLTQASIAPKAKEELETAVRLDPNHLKARFDLMQYYVFAPGIAGGSMDKAQEQANEIKRRDAYQGHRAWALIDNYRKKPELARKEWIDFVREQPSSSKARLALGAQYLVERNLPAAATEFEAAAKLDPNNTQVWFRTGQIAALTGTNLPNGEQALRKYLATTPKPEELPLFRAHYWLGLVLEKSGRKADAKASYTTSLSMNPEQKDVGEALKRVSS